MDPDTERSTVAGLKQVTWPVSGVMFNALCEATTSTAYELTVIKEKEVGRKIGVCLFRRPSDDPYFANQWHSPGTTVRVGDTEEIALSRLLKNELGAGLKVSDLVFVDRMMVQKGDGPTKCARGQETALIFYAVWKGADPTGAMLADPDDFPSDIIGFHRLLIRRAVEKYKNDRAGLR